jgi:NAD(P)-dependent dehydrogenase (short-subunit alcohol dehydrogenase family)
LSFLSDRILVLNSTTEIARDCASTHRYIHMRDTCLSRRVLLPSASAAALLSALPAEIILAAEPPRPFLVTGSSSGIGRASTFALSGASRFVLCGARTASAAQSVAAAQDAESLGGYGLALGADLEQSDLESVKTYAGQLSQDLPGGVEGVLLCAGVESLPLRRTPQGVESTFGINTLSHFVIAVELAARAVQERRALRVVSVTSSAAFDSRLGSSDALDLSWERRPYDARQAYVDSKACNVLLADELQRRVSSTAVLACSVDPGPTASMLVRYALPQRAAQRVGMSDEQLARQARTLGLRTPTQAARGVVWCLTSPDCAPGALYLGAASPPDASPPLPTWEQPLPWRNDALAAAVWQECVAMSSDWLSPLARKFVA